MKLLKGTLCMAHVGGALTSSYEQCMLKEVFPKRFLSEAQTGND